MLPNRIYCCNLYQLEIDWPIRLDEWGPRNKARTTLKDCPPKKFVRHWRSSQMDGTMPKTRYLHQICGRDAQSTLQTCFSFMQQKEHWTWVYIVPHLPSLVLLRRSSHCLLQTHTPQCRSRKQLCPLCVQNCTLCATCLQKVYVNTTAVNFN